MSPWTSTGTLAISARRCRLARASSDIGSETTSSLYGSCFSSSATIAWNTHGNSQLDSANSVSGGVADPDMAAKVAGPGRVLVP